MSIGDPKDHSKAWTLPTAGAALPLVSADLTEAANNRLGIELCALQAVTQVEASGSGFDSKNRPTLRYENHKFQEFTDGRYDDSDSDLSCAQDSQEYRDTHNGDPDQQWDLLTRAFQLDKVAAVKACSWGLFQVMGFNAGAAGWGTDETGLRRFVEAMFQSEVQHLNAFCGFVLSNGYEGYLRDHDWTSFALHYNGDEYWKNAYDTKMAQYYADCMGAGQ